MKEYLKDLDCWLALIVCTIIPITIVGHNTIINLAMLGLMGVVAIFRHKSAILIYMALMACFPLVQEDGNTLPFKMMDRIRLVYPIFIVLLSLSSIKKCKVVKTYLILSLFYLALSVVWYLINNSEKELYGITNFLVMYLPVFILFYYSKIPLDKFFRIIDVIVLISGFYAFVEFFYRWNPYAEIANFHEGSMERFNVANAFRADGLVGNPIVLSDLFLFELCFIVIRSYISRKFNLGLFLVVSFFSMLTVSRTSTLGLVVVVLTWLVMSFYKNGRIQPKYIVAIVVGGLFLACTADVAINFLFVRSSDMSNEFNIQSRWSYFANVVDLLADFPLGVGSSVLMDIIILRYSSLYSFVEIDTVDNLFLAQLGAYGFLGGITSYMMYYYYFYARKIKGYRDPLFYGIITLTVMLLFISFTHEWNCFVMPLLLLSSSSALLIRDMERKNLKKRI